MPTRALILLTLPTLAWVGRLGEGCTWLLFEILHVAVLLLATSTTSPTVAVACVAAFGAPFAAFLVIPYSIVGRAAAQGDSRGAYMATMNLFLCLPGDERQRTFNRHTHRVEYLPLIEIESAR